MSLSRITVLDCGASGVSLGTFASDNGTLRCDFLATVALPAAAEDNWLAATVAALETLAAQRAASGPAVIVLPPHAVLLKHLKTPRVAEAKREQIVKFEVAQNIPHAIEEVVWGTVVTGEQEQEIDLLLAAAKLDVVEPLCRAVMAAGFEVRGLVPSAFAVRAAEALASAARAEARLLLGIGARATTFLQLDGERFAVRSLATGGNALVLAPVDSGAGETSSPLPPADGRAPTGAESVESWVTRLVQEARRSILHFQRQNGLGNPAVVRLAGDSRRHPDLPARIQAQLALPVEQLEVARAIRFAAGVGAEAAGGALDNLAGAAALQLRTSDAAVNLLPPSVRRGADLRRRRPWLVAAALLAAAALVPPIIYYRQAGATARAQVAEIDAGLAPLRAREARNRVRLEEIAALTRETSQLRALDERRTGWIRLFADLQGRFMAVEDVWLENLQTVAPAGDAPMKLAVSGRMLDRTNPLAKVSPETVQRVQALLAGLAGSPFVSAVEGQRFDNSRPGILKFDFVLVTHPEHPL